MKRGIALIFVCLFLVSFTFAITDPESTAADENYEKVQNLTEKIPLDNSGEIDQAKVNNSIFFVSLKAQEKVDKINAWLTDNLSWLHLIFRMVPSISWLFAWNLYFMLLGLTYLILNFETKLGPFFGHNIYGLYLGVVVFLVLLFSNAYVFFADLVVRLMGIFWQQIVPWGFIAVILFIVFLFVLVFLALYFPPALFAIARFLGRLTGRKISTNVAKNVAERAAQKANKTTEKAEKQIEIQEEFVDEIIKKRLYGD